jgi:hypothetical protein
MNFNKIRSFCSTFRIVLGLALIATGIYLSNYWFFLGIIPVIAGVTKFCPLCIISGKCDSPNKEEEKNESN